MKNTEQKTCSCHCHAEKEIQKQNPGFKCRCIKSCEHCQAKEEKAEVKCKYCYDKGYYTVFQGEIGYDDFGGEGYEKQAEIKKRPCPRCKPQDSGKCERTSNGQHFAHNILEEITLWDEGKRYWLTENLKRLEQLAKPQDSAQEKVKPEVCYADCICGRCDKPEAKPDWEELISGFYKDDQKYFKPSYNPFFYRRGREVTQKVLTTVLTKQDQRRKKQ